MFKGIRQSGNTIPHQNHLPRHRRSASLSGVLNRQTHTGRNVEPKNGLKNALDNLLERLSESFKPIGDFLCKHFSWENLMKFGRDTTHQAKQEIYDLSKEAAGSNLERVRLEAQKQRDNLKYKSQECVVSAKQRLNRWFD